MKEHTMHCASAVRMFGFAACTLALALMACCAVFSLPQQAYADTSDDGYIYTVNSDGTSATLTGYTGSDTALIVPSELDGYTVTAIGSNAFASNTKLVSIYVPSTVTKMGESAFYYCTKLTYVDLADTSIPSVEYCAFFGCSALTSVYLPSTVTNIYDYAFECCTALESMDLSDTALVKVWCYAFDGCTALETLSLPKTVTEFQSWAFGGCTALTSITYNCASATGDYTVFYSAGTATSGMTVKFGSAVSSIEAWMFNANNYANIANVYVYNKNATFDSSVFNGTTSYKLYGYAGSSAYFFAKHHSAATFVSLGGSVSSATVSLSYTSTVYTGKAKKPSLSTVKINGWKLTKGTDYTVTYAKGRKAIGTYKVTIKGKGKYTGTKTLKFKIVPKKTTLKSSTKSKAKGKLTVKWGKVKGAGKYQVYYRVKGTSKWKSVTVSGKKASKTLAKLKSGKTYQVKVRAFKKAKGKTYYGSFSKVKAVKVK